MEISTPITVYWDLPEILEDIDEFKRVSADIMALNPLMLQLKVNALQESSTVISLLECYREVRIAVSLTVNAEDLLPVAPEFITSIKLKEFLIAVDDIARVAAISSYVNKLLDLAPVGTDIGLSVSIAHDNWRDVPLFIQFCRSHNLKRLVFPMQRLYCDEVPFFLSKSEQRELNNILTASGGTEGLNITIHDPFIWRAFNPEVPFPQGGCQAANTMIAISSDGGVYPCPSLPIRLGDVSEKSLKEIVLSPTKKEFRKSLLGEPADCSKCIEFSVCRGGCRGRSFVQYGNLDGIDSACLQ